MTLLPNNIKIDLSALVHNLDQVKRSVTPGTKIMGVVKTDAYGHGLLPVSLELQKNGVDCLGVAHLYEAMELRKNGIKIPLVILCGIRTREDAETVVKHDLTPVISDLSSAEVLAEECAGKRDKRIHIQLKVDTGMGRLGISHQEIGPVLHKLKAFEGVYLEALTSHLSSADDLLSGFTESQIKNFQKSIDIGRDMGLDLPLNNLANSAGVMAHRNSHFNMVRPGIMLYGGLPSPDFKTDLSLLPVMGFKGRILQIRDLPDQTPVSYGRTYYTQGQERIAVLSAGYGDGLPRCFSNRGKVLLKGRRVNIVGKVCMNMIMTDITGMNDVRPGQEVVFLGDQGAERITGEDMARWGETISYEIFCSLGRANTREFIS